MESRVSLPSIMLMLSAGVYACGSEDSGAIPETEQRCGLVGCGYAFQLEVTLPVAVEQLDNAEITACRNADCLTGTLRVYGTSSHTLATSFGNEPDAGPRIPPITVSASQSDSSGEAKLRLGWNSWYWENPIVAHPDEFEIRIASRGMTLYSVHKTIQQYKPYYPNGEACGPTCYQASVTDP
jgi:hypothetical protein